MDFASAVERSAQLRSKLAAIELALNANPADKGLRITYLSSKRRVERAENLLVELASEAQIDVCRYKLVRSESNEYFASSFANSLLTYQHLFTALYDFVKSGAKSVATYKSEIRERSLLNLAYTYPGSMGVLLTVEASRDLFGGGELDKVIAGFEAVTHIQKQSDVKQIAHEYGLNVVRKTHAWAEVNAKSDFSVDMQWHQSSARLRGGVVPRNRLARIAALIGETSDEQPREFLVEGTLSGYSILTDTFAVVSRNGDLYKGQLGKNFVRREYIIPSVYMAKILANTTVKYAEESAETTYTLLSLNEVGE